MHAQVQYAQKLWDASKIMNNIKIKINTFRKPRRRDSREVLWKVQTADADACWIVFVCFLNVLCDELGLNY